MKITSAPDTSFAVSSNAVSSAAKNGPNATVLAQTSASKSTQSAGVAVSVSAMTRSLEAGSGNEAADVDTDKVAAIMKQIDNGTYKVNPEAIADAMLFDARSMVKR